MPKIVKMNPEYMPLPSTHIEDAAHHAMPMESMPMDKPKMKKGKKKMKKGKK